MNTPMIATRPDRSGRLQAKAALARAARAALAATLLAAACGCAGYTLEFANTQPDSMKRLADPYDARSTINIWTVN